MATKDAQILRRQINKRLQTLVNQTNMDILQMFKGIGVNYVPFQLIYNEYEVKTDTGGFRPVKNVTLDIDPDFLEKFPNEELDEITKSGSISSEFDEFGTLRLDYDESTLVKSTITLPLLSDIYDDDAVEERFDVSFSETTIVIPEDV